MLAYIALYCVITILFEISFSRKQLVGYSFYIIKSNVVDSINLRNIHKYVNWYVPLSLREMEADRYKER